MADAVCLDASVLVKVLLPEPGSEEAERLLGWALISGSGIKCMSPYEMLREGAGAVHPWAGGRLRSSAEGVFVIGKTPKLPLDPEERAALRRAGLRLSDFLELPAEEISRAAGGLSSAPAAAILLSGAGPREEVAKVRRKKKRNPFSGLRTRSARKTGTMVEPDIRKYDRRRGRQEVRKAADEAAFDISGRAAAVTRTAAVNPWSRLSADAVIKGEAAAEGICKTL